MIAGWVGAFSTLGYGTVVSWVTNLGGTTRGSTVTGTDGGCFLVGVGGVISSQNILVKFARASNFLFDNFVKSAVGAIFLSVLAISLAIRSAQSEEN